MLSNAVGSVILNRHNFRKRKFIELFTKGILLDNTPIHHAGE